MTEQAVGCFPYIGKVAGARKEEAKGNQKDERQEQRILGDGLSLLVPRQAHLRGCPQYPHFYLPMLILAQSHPHRQRNYGILMFHVGWPIQLVSI